MEYCLYSVRKGTLGLDGAGMTQQQMEKILHVVIVLNIYCIVMALQFMPVFTYPLSGLAFSINVVFCKFVGQMTFMTGKSAAPPPGVEALSRGGRRGRRRTGGT